MTLVFLHALPLDGRMWKPQGAAFPDAAAPTLYARGRSMDEWAESVLDEVEGPLFACGASMGGYCALAIARLAPERLRGLALVGARIDADSPERRAGRQDTIALIRSGGAAALWEDMRPKLFSEHPDEAVVARAKAIALELDADDLVVAVEAIRDRPDSTHAVAALTVPVLVTVGEHDPFFPPDEARAAAEETGARLHVFDGVGHLPSLERPDEFNRLLADLL